MGTILKNGINYSGSGSGGGGVSSYNELTDKPSINNVTLTGNKTTSDLGIATSDSCYTTDDTVETTLADGDYFPFYDTSASAKRKSLWSNIKSVLKTYFDTLYSTVTTSKSASSGGTTLSLVTTGEKYTWNSKQDALSYSTSEKAIGKWTDNKTLYQKVISNTFPTVSTQGTESYKDVSLGVTASSVVSLSAIAKSSAGSIFTMPYYMWNTSLGTMLYLRVYMTGNSTIRISSNNTSASGAAVTIIVQYTK